MLKHLVAVVVGFMLVITGSSGHSRTIQATDIRLFLAVARLVHRNTRRASRHTQPTGERYPPPRSHSHLKQKDIEFLINYYSRKHNLDPRYVKAVVKVESNFNPRCLSKAGAMGLMQLMPGTARQLGVRNPWNPVDNIAGGVKYLAQLKERFKDDTLTLAAYNAGPGNVEKYNGIPPFKETQRYVKKVLAAYREYCRKS